ncbi:Band protein 2 [Taenia solium]|eukprot:TsM_000123100 transcript=TsM_000123100 gene=TsM_000123100
MTAASPAHINLDANPDVHKKGQSRKGSLFTLFNLASNERINETTDVDIQLFDGTKMRAFIDYKITGKILVNHIATELGDASKAKYLGLIIERPAKGFDIIMVRIKFYPADPVSEMSSDCFANLLYYQLRHDLAVGRLLGKERDRCLLVAYSVQYEGGLGGVPRDKLLQYDIVRSKISPHSLDNSMQNQIKEYLQENYDISLHDALAAFLRVATRMDTYGIEPFDAKDQRGNGIAVGFNFKGLSVFKSSQQVNFFRCILSFGAIRLVFFPLIYSSAHLICVITLITAQKILKVSVANCEVLIGHGYLDALLIERRLEHCFAYIARVNATGTQRFVKYFFAELTWSLLSHFRESMLNYECEKKTVVITIKTRDLKKKIGFKCDSRANAMQLYRRLREASRFYRSTDSEASDSSLSSGQTCQVKRIASFSRPQRFFTLSPPRVSEKMVQLRVPSAEAVTPTNQPRFPVNCPPDIPAIFLHPPNPDEGPKTPTLGLTNLTTEPTEVAMVGLTKEVDPVASECVAKEEDVKSHSGTSEFQNVKNNEKKGGEYRDPTRMEEEEGDGRDVGKGEKIEEIAGKENEGKIENQYEKNAIKVEAKAEEGEEEEEEEETDLSPTGVNYTPNSISQESLLNVASPFGDAAKMSFFTNLDSNRLGLGVLDLKLSNSMSSITIPPTGCASTASHLSIFHWPIPSDVCCVAVTCAFTLSTEAPILQCRKKQTFIV